MFKPLLRTLPSLTGNISLSCIVDKSLISKSSNNEYTVSIKDAELIPLQNSLYNKRIPVSLLTQNWEYNVSTFYNTYSSIFYKNNYNLPISKNQEDYKIIDLNSINQESNRNTDYEYGCKRVRYLINNDQFSFFAPIYIDNVNSLPDYFVINIKINERYSKKIKICIAKDNKVNYLGEYLKRYLSKIDDNVIFCLPYSSQATYYGISCSHGGFEEVKDNEFGELYNYYTTINNFDYNICNGFERNKIIIRQIIPLAFRFNINDLLNENERKHFRFYKFNISGYYENDSIKYDFYDFDIEYNNSYPKHRIYNPNIGNYVYNSDINVMDIGYPSLKEGKLYEYRYSNKISPHYCKWKLKLSSDSNPYIVNLSYGYSYLNYPELKYGEFPTMFKDIHPRARIVENSLKLPYGKYKEIYYEIDKVEDNIVYSNYININKYNKLIRNSYSSWFNIYDENHIFDKDNWANINNNEAYFKGVFYDLSKICTKYPLKKFAVFINPICNYIDKSSDIKKANFVIMNEEDDETKIVKKINYTTENNDIFILAENTSAYSIIKNDVYMKEDENGTFIEYKYYNKNNIYYKINDLIDKGCTRKNENGVTLFNYDIISFELLNIRNNKNMFEDYYDNETSTFKERIFYNEMFAEDTTNNRYANIKNRLYVSNIYSTNKIKLSDIYSRFTSDEDVYGKYALYILDTFISINNILTVFDLPKGITKLDDLLNSCQKYEYIPYNNDNGIEIKDYFIKKTKSYPAKNILQKELKEYLNNFIFVDPENLTKYIDVIYENDINDGKIDSESINNIKKIIDKQQRYKYFCKFIDKNHIEEWYRSKFDEENPINILEYIYNRKRILQIKTNENTGNQDVIIKDSYIKLSDLFDFHQNGSVVEKINIENINEFFDVLSDNRIVNNKFSIDVSTEDGEDMVVYLDLCFEKEFILLTDTIKNNVIFKKKYNEDEEDKEITLDDYNYLYMFKLEDTNDDNYDIFYKYGYDSKYENFYSKFILKDTNDYMVPLFTNIYLNDDDKKLGFNILKDNSYEYNVVGSKTTTIYSINNVINCFYEISKTETTTKYVDNYQKTIITHYIDKNPAIIIQKDTAKNTIDKIEDINGNIIDIDSLKYYSIYNVLDIEINNNIDIENIKRDIFKAYDDNQNNDSFNKSLADFANYKKITSPEYLNEYVNDNLHEYIEFLNSEYAKLADINVEYTTSKQFFYENISLANRNLIEQDEETGINIYEYDNEYYGAYILDISIDNTNMSIYTTYDDLINFVNYTSINNYSISNNDSFTNIMKEVFWRIYPFVKVNLFTYLVKELNNIVILPTEFNLKTNKYPIKYVKESNKDNTQIKNNITENEKIIKKRKSIKTKTIQNIVNDDVVEMIENSSLSNFQIDSILDYNIKIKNEIDLFNFLDIYKRNFEQSEYYKEIEETTQEKEYYTLINLSNEKNIKLVRYFNKIVPYIKNVSMINDYTFIKLKENVNYIDSDITYNQDIYINKCNPIRIYTESNKYKELLPYEYKHFNDNLLYNFEEKFTLGIDDRLFTDYEIKKYRGLETTVSDNVYSPYYMFAEYLKNMTNNRPDIKNCMLFLFNNYNIKYNIDFDHIKNDIKYYTMSYEFTLK